MCCPLGDAAQRWKDATCSTLNVSSCTLREKIPRRLTQPPRLVDTVTSGEAVTMRSASSPPSRASVARILPKLSWVESFSPPGAERLSGTGMCGA